MVFVKVVIIIIITIIFNEGVQLAKAVFSRALLKLVKQVVLVVLPENSEFLLRLKINLKRSKENKYKDKLYGFHP